MTRQATIKICPSWRLKGCRWVAQVLEEGSFPELILYLIAQQYSSSFKLSAGVTFRQLVVLLNADPMDPGNVYLSAIPLCFSNNIIVLPDHAEVIHSSSMLTYNIPFS